MPAAIKPVYGTQGVAVAFTITSLASGSAWQSVAVDNSALLYLDMYVTLKTKTGSGSIGTDPYFYLYVVGSSDGGTTWPDAVTGLDATITAGLNAKAKLLGAINLAAQTTSYTGTGFSVLAAFGGVAIPQRISFVGVNSCGVALSATAGDHVLTYQGYQAQVI